MKKVIISLMLAAIFVCPVYVSSQVNEDKYSDMVTFTGVDALKKVLREESYFEELTPRVDAAKGEHASFQFVVRSSKAIRQLRLEIENPKFEMNELRDIKAEFVGYVKVSRFTKDESMDRIYSVSGYYPDPILKDSIIDLKRETTQSIWITVNIPKETVAGFYTGKIKIEGQLKMDNGALEPFSMTRTFNLKVYPVVMKTPSLWIANWYFTDPNTLAYLNDNKPVIKYSNQYWDIVRMFAKKLKEYYQNVGWTSTLDLTNFTKEKDKWKFDFSNFDKTIKIFIDEGVIGRIEGCHLGGRTGDWFSGYQLYIPEFKGDSTNLKLHPISDEVTVSFYNQFLPALMQHLKEKGWAQIYMQHLGDEPIDENALTYIEIAQFIKKIVPDIKLIDAVHTTKIANTLNIWVPQINYCNDDFKFFAERMKAGDEVWIYTCCGPKGEYPNRFIELPLLKVRLMHWINFKYGYTGYLHWGFNYWGDSDSKNVFEETSALQSDGNPLPGGDSWIVYPYKGKLLSSIRLEAMRDGIADYELLKMLEEKNPGKAKELCSKMVSNFTNLDMNPNNLRNVRMQILEFLSKF